MSNESPLIYARFVAQDELRNNVTPEERRWLHEHPQLWLRALIEMQHAAESHIAEDRKRVHSRRPEPGKPQDAYLREKRKLDERESRRLIFLRTVRLKKHEVAAICGTGPAQLMMGDVIATIIKIGMLIDTGEITSAREYIETCARKWSEECQDNQ